VNPGLLAVRSIVEELLRVAAVLMALLLWPADLRTHLGIWVGAGCALVWLALATAQTVTTRRRIARPGEWSENAISTMLAHGVGARSTAVMRLLDVTATALLQVGARALVILSPLLVAAPRASPSTRSTRGCGSRTTSSATSTAPGCAST